jgi:hypothetical protein
MGKESRRRAVEKLQAGIIPIRIGKKVRAKERKGAARKAQIFMIVRKGEAPLCSAEINREFEKARGMKEEVAVGTRASEKVDLGELDLPEMKPEMANLIADAVLVSARRVRLRHAAPGGDER